MIRFIEDAKKTGKSAKGTSLNVVELVKASHESIAESPQCDLVELQWRDVENALRTEIKETGLSFGKGLVLADVSGSMTCDRSIPLYLSVGMAILVSHLAEEPWKNKFVTFEKDPEFVDISECKTLKESIDTVLRSRIGLSTDFLAAFYLILSTAVEHRLQPEQLPSFFLVVSDMQFDEARSDDLMFLQNAEDSAVGKYGKELYEVARTVQIDNLGWATHHDLLKKLFFDVGISTVGKPYLLPMMIYWNARSTGRVPVLSNEKGAQMISGYSPNLLKLFLSDGNFDNIPTPWETFRKAMDHLVYQPVRKIIERVKEHPHFIYYEAPNIDENDNKKKRRIE